MTGILQYEKKNCVSLGKCILACSLVARTFAVVTTTCPVAFIEAAFKFISTFSFEYAIDKISLVDVAICKIENTFA
jgi:Fe-S-cluster-containing dehydrogenase component